MENKDYSLRIKAMSEEGQFTAWAAKYGEVDLQSDVIEKGAFTRSINEAGAAGWPLLWAHDQSQPVGTAKLVDHERGPLVEGVIDRDDPAGALAYNRIKKGLARGVSIGFLTPNPDAVKYDREGNRHIHELKLMELSLVVIPAQPGATIVSVKTLADAARVLDLFTVESLGHAERGALATIQKHVARLMASAPGAADGVPDAVLLDDLRDLAGLFRAA